MCIIYPYFRKQLSKIFPFIIKLDASVYHVNTREGPPSHFSNKSYTLIIILPDNQFVHVIIK